MLPDRLKYCKSTLFLLAGMIGLCSFFPPPAQAIHLGPEGNCYNCHTLNNNEGEEGTSFINSISRTLPLMKAFNTPAGTVPELFGCTYCHNNPAHESMKEVLSHFGNNPSKHPVGYDFVGSGETNNEYFSTWDSATPNELDCIDCHDPLEGAGGSSYPEHGAPQDDPYMLRNVSVAGEYDDLCRMCHGGAAALVKGQDVRVSSHSDEGEGNPIVESDGTPLRVSETSDGMRCTVCHDTHFSNNQVLFNDGHEGDTAISTGDCTSVCHYAGDPDDSYLAHGHGKAQSTYRYSGGEVDMIGGNHITMGMDCTSCHVFFDPGAKPHVEDPSSGTDQEKYVTRYNLNISLQAWDTGSSYGNPLVGVCYQCHSSYETHVSDGAGTEAGCLDCHDEHGENSGAGNVLMLPETSKRNGTYVAPAIAKSGSEAVTYDSSRIIPASGAMDTGNMDFYRADAAGACDNGECHGSASWWSGGLSGHMDSGGGHSGGGMGPGADCGTCHSHYGVPTFIESCEGCHGCPPYIPPSGDAAPNVMGDGSSLAGIGSPPKPCDDGTFGYNVTGHGANGSAPGTPGPLNATSKMGGVDVSCDNCHELGATHNDGTLDSIWGSGSTLANPVHLNSAFFTPVTSVSSGPWDVQVTFDNRCYDQCHSSSGVNNMRHQRDTRQTNGNYQSVEFGTHFAASDGGSIASPAQEANPPTAGPYPVDRDLTSNAPGSGPNFAVCVTCHDPHGTNVDEPQKSWNHMVRENWSNPSSLLCSRCH